MKDDIAVVQIGKSQYITKKGDQFLAEKIEGNAGDEITLDKVLLQVKKDKISLGNPFLKNTVVKAKILDQTKTKKIHVLKYKAKSRYRRKKGHRQQRTRIEIL